MIWVNVDGLYSTEIASSMEAHVWEWGPGDWTVSIIANELGLAIWEGHKYPDKDAAKVAVAHWIGRTMAQFSNALAAGFPLVDEE